MQPLAKSAVGVEDLRKISVVFLRNHLSRRRRRPYLRITVCDNSMHLCYAICVLKRKPPAELSKIVKLLLCREYNVWSELTAVLES